MVIFKMITIIRTYREIIGMIVKFIPIEMMDDFMFLQRSSNLGFHNYDMFSNISLLVSPRMVGYKKSFISLLNNKRFPLMRKVMFFATIMVGKLRQSFWPDMDRFIAERTFGIGSALVIGGTTNITAEMKSALGSLSSSCDYCPAKSTLHKKVYTNKRLKSIADSVKNIKIKNKEV